MEHQMNVNIIQNKGQLSAEIRNILHTGKALDKAIHTAACSALWHCREYGDTGFVAALLSAMPKGSRVKGLIHWIQEHSPINIKPMSEGGYKVTARGWDKPEKWAFSAACAKPFWDFSVEKDPKPMTVEKLVAFLNRLADNDDTSKVDPEARRLAATLAALAA
jgi:hypothetical protein